MPELLQETQDGNKIYWGSQPFVDSIIKKTNEEGEYIAEGAFGATYKVDNLLVKKTKEQVSEEDFKSEVDASNQLQAKIPEFVTQLKGARWDPTDESQYMIYDYLEGQTLTKILQDAETMDSDVQSMHKKLSYVYAALMKAKKALETTGLVHSDIKPDNLFFKVDGDWSNASCKFIDFGATRPEGSNIHVSSGPYSALDVQYEDWPSTFHSGDRQKNTNFILDNKLSAK